jgi:hypothetical protein
MNNFIFDSAEEANKLFENQANQACKAAVIQGLGEMLRQVNPFSEAYNECIK